MTELNRSLLVDKIGLSAVIKVKGKTKRHQEAGNEDEEIQSAINFLKYVLDTSKD
jgi:hypothetical protein